MPMTEPNKGIMFDGHVAVVERFCNCVVLDRTKFESGNLVLPKGNTANRWCVYTTAGKYFGEYQCHSSKKKALAAATRQSKI